MEEIDWHSQSERRTPCAAKRKLKRGDLYFSDRQINFVEGFKPNLSLV